MGRKLVDFGRSRTFEVPLHPLTRELMAVLPPPGSTWPIHKQEAFLKAAEAIFDLLYEDEVVTERLRRDWYERLGRPQ